MAVALGRVQHLHQVGAMFLRGFRIIKASAGLSRVYFGAPRDLVRRDLAAREQLKPRPAWILAIDDVPKLLGFARMLAGPLDRLHGVDQPAGFR